MAALACESQLNSHEVVRQAIGAPACKGTGTVKEVAAVLLRGGQRLIQIANRIRRRQHRENEVRELLHVCLKLGAGGGLVEPVESFEGHDEVLEGELLIAAMGVVTTEETDRAIPSPVHVPVILHAPQRLGRHRSLHRGKVAELAGAVDDVVEPIADSELLDATDDGKRTRGVGLVRVSEIPDGRVVVPEDVAARARGFTVGRGALSVVEHEAPLADGEGLRVVEGSVVDLGAAREIHHGNAVVEARCHVQSPPRLVEHDSRRPSPADADVVRALDGGIELGVASVPQGVVLEVRGVEDADLAPTRRRRRTDFGAVAGDGHLERRREAVVLRCPPVRREGASS